MWLLAAFFASLTLSVTPAHCFEPCTIRYKMTILNVEDVKAVCIWLDSIDGFGRTSCWPPFARVVETQIKDVPAGYYVARAAIQRANSPVEWSTEHQITVLSSR